jgi:transposase-like protein
MPAHKGHPGGCRVCAHTDRTRIELLLADGAGQSAIARKYGLSKDSVHRHWRDHVSEERRAALMFGPVQRMALETHVSEEAVSLIDHYRAVRAGLYKQFNAADEVNDRNGVALMAGRLLRCLDSMARLTGQLAQSPLVQNNTINNFFLEPAFASFQADLIRVLSRFPEARASVLQEFERLEAAAPVQLPALEHHVAA